MAVDRSRLPDLGPEPPFAFPEIGRRTLPAGLRVWTVERRDAPVVNSLLLMPVGAADDPPGLPGLAALAGDMLDEGCGDLDALAFHDALARIGANLDTEVGVDATLLSLTMLERFADRGLRLLAGMVAAPRVDPADFARVRELRANRLVQLRDVPSALAERVFARALYGDHPYGHLSIGTEASVAAMTLEAVREFHAAYDPAAATLIVVGRGSHDELAALADEAFAGWRGGRAAARRERPHAIAGAYAEPVVRVHRQGAAQTELRIGHVAVSRDTPAYHALLTLNMVLGGQFVSRINMKLREEKGYTYGARTSFDFRRGPGPFVLQASVQSDATVDAIRDAVAELSDIRGPRPVTEEELVLGRAALTRGYPRNFETGEQIGRAAAQLALYGLPDDYYTTFVPTVLGLTAEQLTQAAFEHIHPGLLRTVVVGDRDTIGPELSAFGAVRDLDPSSGV
jgi:zinc protease